MTSPNCPCHGCSHRYVGCHGSCEGYKRFKEETEDLNMKYRKERQKDEWARHGR